MRLKSSIALAAVVLGGDLTAGAAEPAVRYVRQNGPEGFSGAVVVPAGAALVHTAQFFPTDEMGQPIHPSQTEAQLTAVFDRLAVALQAADSGLDKVVKLNAVLARDDLLPTVRDVCARRIPGPNRPALSVVVGELARPGALVAIDAVALSRSKPDPGRVERTIVPNATGHLTGGTVAYLPAGPRIYVSGQAEKGADLAAATQKTLESLGASLKHLGLGKEHVVQVRAFFLPMKSADVVEREVKAFFGADVIAPPLVLVDWRMPQPIEIELIAAPPTAGGSEVIEYLATPTLKPSPVFSRIARINRGDLVYISGLFGAAGTSGPAQIETIFEQLKTILTEAGSDLRHLAKATYYVSDDSTSKALNELRPRYFDPARPPAASKAGVPGVGLEGRTITLDMIAVVPGDRNARP